MSTGKIKQLCLFLGFFLGIAGASLYLIATNKTRADVLETDKREECLKAFQTAAEAENEASRLHFFLIAIESCPTTCEEKLKEEILGFGSASQVDSNLSKEKKAKNIEELFRKNLCDFK
jgi:hypothetical protein